MAEPLDPGVFTSIVTAMPRPLQLELTPGQAAVLVAQLQLALRHPENGGPAAEVAHDLATMLQAGLQMQNPAIEPYLNAGWEDT